MIYASSNINLNISNQNNNPLASYRAAIIENNQVAVEQCAVALVNKYSSSIYRQGLKIWYGRPERFQLADELTQVTLIKICASAKSYRPEMNPRTWIYAITANSARDMARHANALKRQSEPLSNIGSDGENWIDLFIDTCEQAPINRVCSAEAIEEIKEEIAKLPDHERGVMELVINDAKLAEIAVKLGIPVGTVKSRSHTARKHLQKSLEERGFAFGSKCGC